MTKANRATFLGKVGTTLREYGYKIKYLDEDYLVVTDSTFELTGQLKLSQEDYFLCTLTIGLGGRLLRIIPNKSFFFEEIDKVVSVFKVAIDEVNKVAKTSEIFADSLQPTSVKKDTVNLANEYTNHFHVCWGKKNCFYGLTYSLTVCLNESLDLRVHIENVGMNKLVYSKLLTDSNYKEVFEEVDELIKQFERNCGVSRRLMNLCV